MKPAENLVGLDLNGGCRKNLEARRLEGAKEAAEEKKTMA